jgi:hypothetical protein
MSSGTILNDPVRWQPMMIVVQDAKRIECSCGERAVYSSMCKANRDDEKLLEMRAACQRCATGEDGTSGWQPVTLILKDRGRVECECGKLATVIVGRIGEKYNQLEDVDCWCQSCYENAPVEE